MSKVRTNSEMLKSFKQYNKTARETKAKIEGFGSANDLILYLEGKIKEKKGGDFYTSPFDASKASKSPCPTTTKAPTAKGTSASSTSKNTSKASKDKVVGRPIIHVIDVLDSSGSMYGNKIAAAIKGINVGITGLKTDKAPVDYTYTLCDFSDDIIFRYTLSPLSIVGTFKGETRGSTALFDAIGKSIETVKPSVKSGDKVLVNIYTDGQENSSRHYTAEAISTLIKSLSETGWTFTFIGTEGDVKYAQSRLSIKDSNTLVYDGTAQGLEKSFATNSVARTAYSASVSRGEDVSEGFFKDLSN